MKPIYTLLCVFTFVVNHCHAKKDVLRLYPCSDIPSELLKKADAVVRDCNMTINIVSESEIHTVEYFAITILNENGLPNAKFYAPYIKDFIQIEALHGSMYDRDGNKLKTLKKKELMDYSYSDGFSLYSDARYKLCDFNYASYPFTVVFELSIKSNSTLFIPNFHPQPEFNCSVQSSHFELNYPSGLTLRYKIFHFKNQPETTQTGANGKVVLSAANIEATKKDDLSPLENYKLPTVIVATDTISCKEFSGSGKSWQSYGKFFYDLNEGRDKLPGDKKAIVHQLVDSCKSKNEKIERLFEYMKSTTRYVSIQLGIGGWQCFDAVSVAQNGYGDCKALSNYMKALLREAGISSYLVLVYAGNNYGMKMERDFPAKVFNHMILCVPNEKDTLWLECTSKDNPAGYLSAFTYNRDVLALMQDGGHVLHTPNYTSSENILNRTMNVVVTGDDELKITASLYYQGMQWDKENRDVAQQTNEKLQTHFNSIFSLPRSKILSYRVSEGKVGLIPYIKEGLVVEGAARINRTGKRVFINPNILHLPTTAPPTEGSRMAPFTIQPSYQINDTEIIHLEGAYAVEYLPDEIQLDYEFGRYACKMTFENDNTIKVIVHYEQYEGVFPPTLYGNFVALKKAANYSTEQKNIVLLKKG